MRRILLVLLFFNAVTALGGGLALIFDIVNTDSLDIQPKLLANMIFVGSILIFIVGGSALLAAIAYLQRKSYAAFLALVSGMILEIWILTEMYIATQFFWMQIFYLISGLVIVILSAECMLKQLESQADNN